MDTDDLYDTEAQSTESEKSTNRRSARGRPPTGPKKPVSSKVHGVKKRANSASAMTATRKTLPVSADYINVYSYRECE